LVSWSASDSKATIRPIRSLALRLEQRFKGGGRRVSRLAFGGEIGGDLGLARSSAVFPVRQCVALRRPTIVLQGINMSF
jgi:hypothetical protein